MGWKTQGRNEAESTLKNDQSAVSSILELYVLSFSFTIKGRKILKWNELEAVPCSVAKALSVIGDRWTFLILRNAFLRTRRFDEFQRQLGITRHLLVDRLSKLVEQEVFYKSLYQNNPERFEYRLTPKGLDLYPLLLCLSAWADKWMPEERGALLQYRHQVCQQHFKPKLVCNQCDGEIHPKEVSPEIGPGLAARIEMTELTDRSELEIYGHLASNKKES